MIEFLSQPAVQFTALLIAACAYMLKARFPKVENPVLPVITFFCLFISVYFMGRNSGLENAVLYIPAIDIKLARPHLLSFFFFLFAAATTYLFMFKYPKIVKRRLVAALIAFLLLAGSFSNGFVYAAAKKWIPGLKVTVTAEKEKPQYEFYNKKKIEKAKSGN